MNRSIVTTFPLSVKIWSFPSSHQQPHCQNVWPIPSIWVWRLRSHPSCHQATNGILPLKIVTNPVSRNLAAYCKDSVTKWNAQAHSSSSPNPRYHLAKLLPMPELSALSYQRKKNRIKPESPAAATSFLTTSAKKPPAFKHSKCTSTALSLLQVLCTWYWIY